MRNGTMVKRRPRDAAPELDGRQALADLMHAQVLGQGDVGRAFKQITETAAQVLKVGRASIWRLVDGSKERQACCRRAGSGLRLPVEVRRVLRR